jgi:hypothetical protein
MYVVSDSAIRTLGSSTYRVYFSNEYQHKSPVTAVTVCDSEQTSATYKLLMNNKALSGSLQLIIVV